MDFKLTTTDGLTASMSFDKAEDITNNIFLSLNVRRGSFFMNPDFGSRLYLLMQGVLNDRTLTLAKEYTREALQWLLDTGRATAVEVTAERHETDLHRINLHVQVTQADGRDISFETFFEVI